MKLLCTHRSRACGPVFERCLQCQCWRLVLTFTWWPQEFPIPFADEPLGRFVTIEGYDT